MTDTSDLFLISAATGKTGARTVELLRERGFRVEAIGGTLPMTVEQYTTATRTSFESQGQDAAWASVA